VYAPKDPPGFVHWLPWQNEEAVVDVTEYLHLRVQHSYRLHVWFEPCLESVGAAYKPHWHVEVSVLYVHDSHQIRYETPLSPFFLRYGEAPAVEPGRGRIAKFIRYPFL